MTEENKNVLPKLESKALTDSTGSQPNGDKTMSEPTTKFSPAWAILSGKTLLPFSIRSTRKQAISDYVRDHQAKDWRDAKRRGNSVQKVWIEYSS